MHDRTLQLLTEHGPPLACFDAAWTLQWASRAWRALCRDDRDGAPLEALVGAAPAAALQQARGLRWQAPDGSHWQLKATAAGSGWLVSAQPTAETDDLRERLALVQEFTRTGIFERDAQTRVGRWDATMFDIWAYPAHPEGLAPSYEETATRILPDDTRPGAFERSLDDPGPHQQRVRIQLPDGRVRHLQTQWKVQHDASGRPLRVIGVNTDDSDSFALAQRAARLSAELTVTLQVSGVGLWRMDLAPPRVIPDPRGCEIIGVPYRPEGLSLEEARERIHPDDRWIAEASAQRTLRTGEPTDMQLRYPAPGGGWRHVMLRRALLRAPDGSPAGFIGVLMDVTERVEEIRRTRDIASRLESAAEAARVGLWSQSRHERLPEWSRRTYELFGLDPADPPLALDPWLQRCVHVDDRQRVRDSVVQWWRRGEGTHEVEFRVVRPSDGQLRWLVVRGQIAHSGPEDAAGRGEGVVIDTTEQQQVLRQLRDAVERMQLTTTALGLGTWSSDIDRKHVVWDAQMFKLRGVDSPAREIGAEERGAYVHHEDREAVVQAQNQHVRDGEPWNEEFRVVWPDGQVRWITSHSVPLRDASGRIEGRIGVNWDSTELHLAGQALRERERAVAESRAKSQAMSRISHELRTPLNAILGFAQLLRGAPADADRERQARWLAHLEDAARHLLALIDDVLELTRAQGGELRLELRLELRPTDCAAVVADALTFVDDLARQRGVTLHAAGLAGAVMADPLRLRQVVINLLSNAIKYNRPDGEVRVSTEHRGERLALHVADSGVGFAPERLRELFEPFNRLGAEGSSIEGSGIGLTIAKVLVEQMGGTIQARSEPGRGSVFSIELAAVSVDRLAPEAEAPVAQPVPAPSAAAPRRVLYIEDNAVNALLVRELLASRPAVQLEVAEDGRSGLAAARARRPDLMLIDMLLPDMSGLEVLQALRADPRLRDVMCIALSANATPGDVDAALQAGFADYWTKPIDLRSFLGRLDAVLGTSPP